MSRIEYREINFTAKTLDTIAHANEIAEDYASQGFSLTLRQLYYRFVAADLIPNKQTEYKRLGGIITDARYAGLFDWSLLEDRTRDVEGGDGSDTDPSQTIDPGYYQTALWQGQSHRLEVWVEKDALVDVIGQAARQYRVPFFSCRGYTSASELHAAALRIESYIDESEDDVDVTILHLGDHDPSGIDMTRDITDRLEEFLDGDGYNSSDLTIRRIALNRSQIDQYDPPPNPAKSTDSRFAGYRRIHGDSSWELDALEPRVLSDLITSNIAARIDQEKFSERRRLEEEGRGTLRAVKAHYTEILDFLRERGWLE